MPEQHEPQLLRRAHGEIVRVDRVVVPIGQRGVEPEHLVVVYRMKFIVCRAGDARGCVLVCEAQYGEPTLIA